MTNTPCCDNHRGTVRFWMPCRGWGYWAVKLVTDVVPVAVLPR